MEPKRYNALKEKADKLLKINFIREAHYLVWLTKSVLVKKSNAKWRNYIHYSDINKAYPKDSFSLSRKDQLVDAIVGHSFVVSWTHIRARIGSPYMTSIKNICHSLQTKVCTAIK